MRPKITCGAIIIKENKVLLTKRNIKPYKDYWCLPGGHMEGGETAKEAVRREVKEELGLDFRPIFFKYYDEIIPKIKWHALVLVFKGKINGNINLDENEVKEFRWFDKNEIKKIPLAFENIKILKDYFENV